MSCERTVHDLPKCTRRRRHRIVCCPECGELFRAVRHQSFSFGDADWYSWEPVV